MKYWWICLTVPGKAKLKPSFPWKIGLSGVQSSLPSSTLLWPVLKSLGRFLAALMVEAINSCQVERGMKNLFGAQINWIQAFIYFFIWCFEERLWTLGCNCTPVREHPGWAVCICAAVTRGGICKFISLECLRQMVKTSATAVCWNKWGL